MNSGSDGFLVSPESLSAEILINPQPLLPRCRVLLFVRNLLFGIWEKNEMQFGSGHFVGSLELGELS